MKYSLIYYSIGDWGASSAHPNSAKFVANTMATYYPYLNPPPNFVISLGDNFYGQRCWQESAMSYGMWLGIQSSSDPFHIYTTCGGFLYWENHDYYGGVKSIESQIEMTKYCKNWIMPGKNYYSYDKETSSYHIFIGYD